MRDVVDGIKTIGLIIIIAGVVIIIVIVVGGEKDLMITHIV